MARVEIHQEDPDERLLVVALSERNLATLLSKLYTPGSTCSIVVGDLPPGFTEMVLTAEPDGVHYASPTRQGAEAGEMHPVTEAILALIAREVPRLLAASGGHLVRLFPLDASEREEPS